MRHRFKTFFGVGRFRRDESGATAIEYSLIAALLFAAITAAWPGFYAGFMASWTNVGAVIAAAVQ